MFSLGCGTEPAPAFKSEADELEWLSTIKEPTAEQFIRRKELQKKADDASAHRRFQEIQNSDSSAYEARVQTMLDEADEHLKEFGPTEAVAEKYRYILRNHSNTKVSDVALARWREIKKAMEQKESGSIAK